MSNDNELRICRHLATLSVKRPTWLRQAARPPHQADRKVKDVMEDAQNQRQRRHRFLAAESSSTFCSLFPGGWAITSMPDSNTSSASIKLISPCRRKRVPGRVR